MIEVAGLIQTIKKEKVALANKEGADEFITFWYTLYLEPPLMHGLY